MLAERADVQLDAGSRDVEQRVAPVAPAQANRWRNWTPDGRIYRIAFTSSRQHGADLQRRSPDLGAA